MKIVKIGRSSSNDVNIDDKLVSRAHCQIMQDDYGDFRIIDTNSKNGTFINGIKRHGEVPLKPTDIVRIGNTTLPWQTYFTPIEPPTPPTSVMWEPIEEPTKGRGMSITGFILAILGLIFSWVPILGQILWLLGLIFSIIGMSKSAKGLAITGLIISIINLIWSIVLITYFISEGVW